MLSPNEDIREQAIWALGNIAGDSPSCRDFVLSQNVMEPLLSLFDDTSKLSTLRNATWTLSNLCRAKPHADWNLVCAALPTLAKLIHSTDDEILTDACWALCFLSDGSQEKIQSVLEAGIARKMTELLAHSSYSVQTPALRTIGNIVTGNDSQTQIMINVSVLPYLYALLNSPKKGIKKEACWTVSNITAGNSAQIQAVIRAQIIPRLVYLIKTADFDVKKEAVWAISNAASGGTKEQVQYLIEQNVLEPLCDLLKCTDSGIIFLALGALENILKVGKRESIMAEQNEFALLIEEAKGVDHLEALQNHPHNGIYERAVSILENYFHTEEDRSSAPNINATNYFDFNNTPIKVDSFHF